MKTYLSTNDITDRDLLAAIYQEIQTMKQAFMSVPDYLEISEIAKFNDLSTKQLYKRVVSSGDFEEGVQYKREDGNIKVSKSILHLLTRKRKKQTPKGVK